MSCNCCLDFIWAFWRGWKILKKMEQISWTRCYRLFSSNFTSIFTYWYWLPIPYQLHIKFSKSLRKPSNLPLLSVNLLYKFFEQFHLCDKVRFDITLLKQKLSNFSQKRFKAWRKVLKMSFPQICVANAHNHHSSLLSFTLIFEYTFVQTSSWCRIVMSEFWHTYISTKNQSYLVTTASTLYWMYEQFSKLEAQKPLLTIWKNEMKAKNKFRYSFIGYEFIAFE